MRDGSRMSNKWTLGVIAGWSVLAAFVVVCGACLAIRNARDVPEPPEPPRIELDALLEDWKRNPVGTEQRYGRRPVRVTGAYLTRYDVTARSGDRYVVLATSPRSERDELVAFVTTDRAYRSVGGFDLGSAVTAEVVFDQGADGGPRSRLRVLLPP